MSRNKWGPNATGKEKAKYVAGAAALVPGAAYAGAKGADAYNDRKRGKTILGMKNNAFVDRNMARAEGYKASFKAAKKGAVAAGVGAGVIGASTALEHHARKKGVIVRKNSSVSAFGVDHG